ncbi:MAG: carboxypeptidase-like regulatory domain-containing protein [Calditrichaeota bacterium]|nr:MAG: carboxypeptidase-like regulatory domain-containing protein [Calditrichota bacterium]
MTKFLGFLLLATTLFFGCSSDNSEKTFQISGSVIHGTNKNPLIGAKVQVEDSDISTVSDFDGTYEVELSSGSWKLLFSQDGFVSDLQELELSNSDSTNINLNIELLPESFFNLYHSRPFNQDTIPETSPNLDWSRLSVFQNYAVQVSESENFLSGIVVDVDTIKNDEFELPPLENNQTYFWRVRVQTLNDSWTEWTTPWSFTTKLPIPEIPDPLNDETILTQTPSFDWEDVDSASVYFVEISEEQDFSSNILFADSTLTESEVSISNILDLGKPFYWHVKIKNSDGVWGEWSETWNFTIIQATEINNFITTNTTWTKANSPYFVNNNIRVESGATLTIESGTEIFMGKDKSLQINGELIAIGTENEKIIFTSPRPNPGEWQNIYFTEEAVGAEIDSLGNYISGSILEHCNISYGGNENGMVYSNKSFFLNFVKIEFSSEIGVYFDLDNGENDISILNCKFEKNDIAIRGSSFYAFKNFFLINNVFDSNEGNFLLKLDLYATSNLGNSQTLIQNNLFQNNISNELADIRTLKSEIIVNENDFINNHCNNSIININFQHHLPSQLNIKNNFIKGNTSNYYLGYLSIYPTNDNLINAKISYNSIIDNICTNSSFQGFQINSEQNVITEFNNNNFSNPSNEFEIYNSSSIDIDLSNNWWGTTDESEIQDKIFDFFDDSNLGIVNYQPFLTEPDTTAPGFD